MNMRLLKGLVNWVRQDIAKEGAVFRYQAGRSSWPVLVWWRWSSKKKIWWSVTVRISVPRDQSLH